MDDEDEVFRRLKRTPLEELVNLVTTMPYNQFRSIYDTAADRSIFFNSHGWTAKEFDDAIREKLNISKTC